MKKILKIKKMQKKVIHSKKNLIKKIKKISQKKFFNQNGIISFVKSVINLWMEFENQNGILNCRLKTCLWFYGSFHSFLISIVWALFYLDF